MSLLLLGFFVSGESAGALDAPGGTVTVTATNNAKILASFSSRPVSFVSSSTVEVYEAPGGVGDRYYAWSGDGAGVEATVKSNTPWSGTLALSEDATEGTKHLVSSGALRLRLSPAGSWAECDAAPVVSSSPLTWTAEHPTGVANFNFYYCLRVEPGSVPQGFDSVLTYRATQVRGQVATGNVVLR